jgi:hypothetical protein
VMIIILPKLNPPVWNSWTRGLFNLKFKIKKGGKVVGGDTAKKEEQLHYQ